MQRKNNGSWQVASLVSTTVKLKAGSEVSVISLILYHFLKICSETCIIERFRGNLVTFGVLSSLSNKYANYQLFEDNCIRYIKSYGWGNSLY